MLLVFSEQILLHTLLRYRTFIPNCLFVLLLTYCSLKLQMSLWHSDFNCGIKTIFKGENRTWGLKTFTSEIIFSFSLILHLSLKKSIFSNISVVTYFKKLGGSHGGEWLFHPTIFKLLFLYILSFLFKCSCVSFSNLPSSPCLSCNILQTSPV